MPSDFLHTGYDNFLSLAEIEAILPADARPVVRMIKAAETAGKLYDITGGEGRKSVIITKSGTIYVSALAADRLRARAEGRVTFTKKKKVDENATSVSSL